MQGMFLARSGASAAIALVFLGGIPNLRGQSTNKSTGTLSEAQVKEIATAIVKAHNAWGVKLNSAGAVLTLAETARDQGRITYRLYAKGLDLGYIYSLVQWPVTQKEPSVALTGVTFDKSGMAICAGKPGMCGDPAKPDDPIDLQTFPVKGEPLRFAMVAQDDPQLRALVKIVPVPNRGKDKGCQVEAVLLMPHAELIWVEASNFPPNTELTLVQDSEGEIQKSQPKTDSTGQYAWAIMPAKAGLKGGTIEIRVQGPACGPSLSVPWGYAGN